jgi:probable rRNA maturation factor
VSKNDDQSDRALFRAFEKIVKNIEFEKMKDAVLGHDYQLSLVIASDELSRRLNHEYRGKNKPTDILSFPLEKNVLKNGSGEIFLNPRQCAAKAREFGRTFENYLAFVFIHGLFHLNGFDHGSRMESEEAKIRKHFGV